VCFSVIIRLVLFALAGLIFGSELLVAALLLPFMFLGLWIGGRVQLRIAPARLARLASLLLLAAGASLLARAAAVSEARAFRPPAASPDSTCGGRRARARNRDRRQ